MYEIPFEFFYTQQSQVPINWFIDIQIPVTWSSNLDVLESVVFSDIKPGEWRNHPGKDFLPLRQSSLHFAIQVTMLSKQKALEFQNRFITTFCAGVCKKWSPEEIYNFSLSDVFLFLFFKYWHVGWEVEQSLLILLL